MWRNKEKSYCKSCFVDKKKSTKNLTHGKSNQRQFSHDSTQSSNRKKNNKRQHIYRYFCTIAIYFSRLTNNTKQFISLDLFFFFGVETSRLFVIGCRHSEKSERHSCNKTWRNKPIKTTKLCHKIGSWKLSPFRCTLRGGGKMQLGNCLD